MCRRPLPGRALGKNHQADPGAAIRSQRRPAGQTIKKGKFAATGDAAAKNESRALPVSGQGTDEDWRSGQGWTGGPPVLTAAGGRRQGGGGGCTIFVQARPAQHRRTPHRLEGHGGGCTATGANHVGLSAYCQLRTRSPPRLAQLAAFGIVLEPFYGEKQLFVCGEQKSFAAVDAYHYFIGELHTTPRFAGGATKPAWEKQWTGLVIGGPFCP